jgi:Lrp/AsnC family transcriptional regulator, leucine-responsive regulatory protein
MIDDTDREILRILQENGRISNAEIARQIGMAPSAIFQRIRRLEERGVIAGYGVRLNARALGCGLVAFIMVQTGENARDYNTAALLAGLPEVQEVHRVVGEDCFIVKVRVQDTDALASLLEHRIQAIASITSTRTTIVVKTIKETSCVSLDHTLLEHPA